MSITSLFGISATRAATKRVALSLTLGASTVTGTALADQCGDLSPALITMGDAYYDVDNLRRKPEPELSESSNSRHAKSELLRTELHDTEQQIQLEQTELFVELRDTRFAGGTGERTRCFGTENNGRVETSSVELTQIRQHNRVYGKNIELVIDANEYDEAQKQLRKESVYFLSAQNTDVLETADGNSLILNSRSRQATKIGAYLRETALSATSTKQGGVHIRQSIYVNGYLAEWSSWSLDALN